MFYICKSNGVSEPQSHYTIERIEILNNRFLIGRQKRGSIHPTYCDIIETDDNEWALFETLKDNILFKHEIDTNRLNNTESCVFDIKNNDYITFGQAFNRILTEDLVNVQPMTGPWNGPFMKINKNDNSK